MDRLTNLVGTNHYATHLWSLNLQSSNRCGAKLRLLALPKYGRLAASNRQRFQQYVPALERAGFDIDVCELFDDRYMARLQTGAGAAYGHIVSSYVRRAFALFSGIKYDAIWLQYENFPYFPGLTETLLLPPKVPVILDFDDAIFHQYDSHRSLMVRALLGRKLHGLMRRASICTPGNRYLAAYAQRYSSDVRIIPTVLDTHLYQPSRRQSRGSVTVGWIGSPSTWEYVRPFLPMLQRLAEKPGVRVKIVGAGQVRDAPTGIEFVDWSEEKEIAEIQSMDIGIMPLPDKPFARGKCGYKLIQYGACGLPVVASPVGVNTEIVVAGETGFLAESTRDFEAELEKLLSDSRLRERLGAAGRARVTEYYSLAAHEKSFVDSIMDAVDCRSVAHD